MKIATCPTGLPEQWWGNMVVMEVGLGGEANRIEHIEDALF
ncbi:MAG: hypothetical protein QGH66_03045 [Dehalococcoidia bacterium]|jgi:hypothetical protein|nr:hypothetical protein [Dehalococcoidia bacterium]MDP7469581.1 hypothetical protein [Dehalococcoidia bacterium]